MNRILVLRMVFVAMAVVGLISVISCSRKSGCPAEDVHMEMDKDGNPKVGKSSSGLLPPKGSKKYKYTKYKKRKRKH